MTTATAARPIDRRYEFVLLFDVINGNPNGDPDAGNAPRVDPETGHGLVSDVALKRKIRNFISLVKVAPATAQPEPGFDIYVKEKAILNDQHQRAYDALGLKVETKGAEAARNVEVAREWMCQTFFDIRMFGAVMSTGVNAGQVRGPVQVAFARSIDPIVSLEQSITRMAVTTKAEAEEQEKKQAGQRRTMGRKEIVPYALYRAHGFISPFLARQTGFSTADLELLWQALAQMFEFDRSAARGEMATRGLYVFEHDSPLGSAPAHQLFERIQVTRKDLSRPARAFSDYIVEVAREDMQTGVKLQQLI